ncbi:hypothetical protein CVT26_015181 [Gymnopilus dilepis]|uniref:Uncharacterized protein n=1 Tax=Gymnopilus dilepis TaxID=231916 RepID=A0A409WQQ9_9AGAR|nr:hypothetical protein CVT26_015181 [Gymnopilus dilepis]
MMEYKERKAHPLQITSHFKLEICGAHAQAQNGNFKSGEIAKGHENAMSATHGLVREDMAPNTNTSRDVDMNADNSTANPMDMDTTTTTEAYTPMYKGKVTHRSWQQLPEEIVRLITTYFLYDYSTTAYCPQTWENRRQWYSRMVFTAIRDTIELERIMGVCPEWKRAIFWVLNF